MRDRWSAAAELVTWESVTFEIMSGDRASGLNGEPIAPGFGRSDQSNGESVTECICTETLALGFPNNMYSGFI